MYRESLKFEGGQKKKKGKKKEKESEIRRERENVNKKVGHVGEFRLKDFCNSESILKDF